MLCVLVNPEAYRGTPQITKMESLTANSKRLKSANYCYKALSLRCLDPPLKPLSLRDDQLRCVAFFYETDSDYFSSVDNNAELCRLQNEEKEVLYAKSEMGFLDCLAIKRELIAITAN